MLHQFFGATSNISTLGITLTFPDGAEATIFAEVGVVLGDVPALKEMISSKGHSGLVPCTCCTNVVHHKPQGGGAPLSEHSDGIVSLADVDMWRADTRAFTKFKLHTDASLRALVQKLHDYKGVLPPEQFSLREKLFGFKYNPYNIIINPTLRVNVASSIMYDWAHVQVCDGVADVEFGLFMKELQSSRSTASYVEFRTYLEHWQLPKTSPSVAHLFTDKKVHNYLKNTTFSSTASEFLTLVPVLSRYMDAVVIPRGECVEASLCFRAALKVLETLQAVKRGGVDPAQLAWEINDHFMRFIDTYGAFMVRPKHHYNCHLPEMLYRFKCLLSTLVHERKHRMVKKYTKNRVNKRSWEAGTIEDITCHGISEISVPFMSAGKSSKPSRASLQLLHEHFIASGIVDACVEYTLHSEISAKHGRVRNGDVVLLTMGGELTAAEMLITAGFRTAGFRNNTDVKLYSIVQPFVARGGPSHSMQTYVVGRNAMTVPSSCILEPVACLFNKNRDVCSVYLPLVL